MAKKKDEMPEWVLDGIQSAKFGKASIVKRTGYILEIYEGDKKMDVQVYDAVEDGRHIVTLDIPDSINMNDLERGVIYEFNFNSFKAPLDKKIVDFLKNEKEIDMDAIYQFELKGLEMIDDGSGENSEE